jgi:hypothetical protein
MTQWKLMEAKNGDGNPIATVLYITVPAPANDRLKIRPQLTLTLICSLLCCTAETRRRHHSVNSKWLTAKSIVYILIIMESKVGSGSKICGINANKDKINTLT